MRLVSSLFSDNWHKQIDDIANGQSPLTDEYELNSAFPFNDVHNYTKQYLASKKERAAPGVSDERLMKLIQRSDRKDVAFATCMNLLSSQAMRTLVVRDFAKLEVRLYLKLLLLAYHGSTTAIDEEEHARAKATLQAFKLGEPVSFVDSQFLKALVDITCNTPIPKSSLVYTTVSTALANACPKLRSELFEQETQKQWRRCWMLTSWLSTVVDNAAKIPADHLNPVEILDTNLLQWRMWAAWQPLYAKTSPVRCSNESRQALWEFLTLEGPDTQQQPKANVCERLLSSDVQVLPDKTFRIGTFYLVSPQSSAEEAKELLRRLHNCISYAIVTNQMNVELLSTLCLNQKITDNALEILEAVEVAGDLELTIAVYKMYKHRFSAADKLEQAKAILPLLNRPSCEKARTSPIASMVVETLFGQARNLQDELRSAWKETDKIIATALELKLQAELDVMQSASANSAWLSALVDEDFLSLLKNWPTAEDIMTLQAMRREINEMRGFSAKVVAGDVDRYLTDLLCQRGSIDEERRVMMPALISFWVKEISLNSRELAVVLANGNGKFRRDCISQLHLLNDGDVGQLTKIMVNWGKQETSQDKSCEDLATFLAFRAWATPDSPEGKTLAAWKPVLYRMLKARGSALVDRALQNMKIEQYVTFLENIQMAFGRKVVWNPKLSPPIMDPVLHQWSDRLGVHLPVLRRLQEEERSQGAIQCFMKGKNPWLLEGILCHLALEDCWVEKTALYQASYGICCFLSDEPDNIQDIYDVLCSVFQMSLGGAAACRRLLDLHWKDQTELATTLFPSWLQDPTWSDNDLLGLQDTARLLHIELKEPTGVTEGALTALADYMDRRYAELLVEAKRLDYMRVSLKTRDCDGVAQLLDDCKIEDATAMEDAFARLPIELLNVVETVSDSEVEMLFPLNDMTVLQRAALGIGNAQSLFVRLYIGDYGDLPRFCIHLDNEPRLDSRDVHAQWVVLPGNHEPEGQICHGSVTPVTYQLARMLSRYFVGGFKDLLSVHTLVATSLKTMGAACIICGIHHGASVRKATICDALKCLNIFSRAPVEIRLADIRQDPMAVDMLLTMIQSALTSGYHHLLPNCPFDKDACLKIMKNLPAMQTLAKSKNFAATIQKKHGGTTEQFLMWACCSFRGFLSTATGSLRIPSLPPGTLQFIIANAAPMKEMTFSSEFNTNAQQSRVVFHGTSLDRLYLILHQGLKNMSGTPLQAYGAAAGPGIYLADEPSTSWAYADRKAAARLNWPNSAIKNGRVLLGCELTGPSIAASRGGVHVIQKEGSVMVRYIFVVPTNTVTMPISGHVSPAMMSVFNSLRSGAL